MLLGNELMKASIRVCTCRQVRCKWHVNWQWIWNYQRLQMLLNSSLISSIWRRWPRVLCHHVICCSAADAHSYTHTVSWLLSWVDISG